MHVRSRVRIVALSVVSCLAVSCLALLSLAPLSAHAASALATDTVVSGHRTSPASSVTSPAITTTHAGDLLVAFVATDGPPTAGGQSSTVSGGSLTWTLRKRVNAQYGTAEIWQAVAPTTLTGATVTATYGGTFDSAITVAAFTGADTTTLGSVGGASAPNGAPTASLTTSRTGSWVWGIGDDWSTATARTVPVDQTMVDQFLAGSGDTFWTQRFAAPGTVAAPSTVTVNDTAPTSDLWNLATIEILPAASGGDTTPPTVAMTNPTAGSTVSGTVTVAASASDNVGVTGVAFMLDGSPLGAPVTASPYSLSWDTTTVAGGSHTLTAVASDAAGNTATSAPDVVTVNNSITDPSVVGSWGPVVPGPLVSIHAALTPNGKILTWQGDFSQPGQEYLLDPATGVYTQVANSVVDLFCAGQAVFADGRIAVIGGTSTSGGLGVTNLTGFDPASSTWQTLAPMKYPRWYPTGTTLGDGRILVTSGANTGATDLVPIPEVYSTTTNTWTALTGASKTIPYYPFMYQLPDGRVLQTGATEQPTSTLALDPATQQWTTIDSRVLDAASVTNYAPGKFMKAGTASDGGFSGPSASTAYTLDMNQPNPAWQPTASMAFPRAFVNLTTLPDGTVLATGGDTEKSGQNEANAVKPAEIWNPSTGTWATVASLTAPRLYHSVALLLPDGRVFVSGGGGDTGVTNETNFQLYSPPYLFKGARPTITQAPSTVQYNTQAFIQTPDAANIASVSLIRTGSVTHSFDQNARSIPLSFTQASGGLNVQLPATGNTAPPGYYMLFIVNRSGVPSVASMTRFPAPAEDTTPPSAPTQLTATAGTGQVALGWGASTDNVGVTKYDVYRSTTAGFTAAAANRIAQVAGATTTYTDAGLQSGTYYYLVQAEDAAGNVSGSSNQATATVAVSSGYKTIAIDGLVTGNQGTSSATVKATGLTTTGSNELLLAFIGSDGNTTGSSIASVTGGGLTWSLRQRSNAHSGTAEIWQAIAPTPLSNVTVTATEASGSWQASMTVTGFLNADTAAGAVSSATGANGAPTGALTTTRNGSWVWGVGNDWTAANPRTVGSGQTLVSQYFAPANDTYWVQRVTGQTPTSGTAVTVNDTAPTSDLWNLALAEILPAP